jgi:hypothetical protein
MREKDKNLENIHLTKQECNLNLRKEFENAKLINIHSLNVIHEACQNIKGFL